MSLKCGKRELAKIEAVLDAEHETVGDAAQAMLSVMEEIFQSRAKFTVVGQLWESGGEVIPPSDPRAIKVALGWYSTEGDARSAAESLVFNQGARERYRTWVLPVTHCSPAELHGQRRKELEKRAAEEREKREAWIRESIKKREAAVGVVREEAA